MGKTWRIGGSVAALVLMAAPLAAQGPGQGPAMGRGMMRGGPEMGRNPAAVVLDHRAELDLTDQQATRIEAIRDRLTELNGPRWEQLKAAFGEADPREMTAEERQALRERMAELQPVRQEIRETNRAAGKEIHEVLTLEQSTALRGIMHADRGRAGSHMRRGGQGQRRGPGPMGGGGPGS